MNEQVKKATYGGVATISLLGVALFSFSLSFKVEKTEGPVRFGWAGPQAVEKTVEIARSTPPFQLVTEDGKHVFQDNRRANVRHWELVQMANGDKYPDIIAQQVGDCTSWGARHACHSAIAGDFILGKNVVFIDPFPPFTYGVARFDILKGQLRGDGATGYSVAMAAKEHGLLPWNTPGLAPYSGALAREWGRTGPPKKYRDIAKNYRIKTVTLARTPDEVMDAICNLYGVGIASGIGFERIVEQDGRRVGKMSGSWMHMMCIDGYDGSHPSGKRYWHIKNSWGKDYHPMPLNTPEDSYPPGGFWIEENALVAILKAEDSYIYSATDGFPERPVDFRMFQFNPQGRLNRKNGDQKNEGDVSDVRDDRDGVLRRTVLRREPAVRDVQRGGEGSTSVAGIHQAFPDVRQGRARREADRKAGTVGFHTAG